jgi:hypothetical protein
MQQDPPHILFLAFLWLATVTAELAAVKKPKETKEYTQWCFPCKSPHLQVAFELVTTRSFKLYCGI